VALSNRVEQGLRGFAGRSTRESINPADSPPERIQTISKDTDMKRPTGQA
jgi:hypothetical protein